MMETFLKNFFNFFYYIFALPYKMYWEPGLHLQIKLYQHSIHTTFWWFGVFIMFLNSVLCWTLFFIFLPIYLTNKEYVHIAFHSQWGSVSLMCIVHLIPHLMEPDGVMQLTNGCVNLIKNLEQQHFGQGSFSKSQRIRTKILYFLSVYALCGFLPAILPIFVYFQKGNWQIGAFTHKAVLYVWQSCPSVLAYILGTLMDVWYCFYIWGTYFLSLHINLSFMHTFKTAVNLIIASKTLTFTNYGSVSSLKKLQEHFLVYSKLRIVTQVYNEVFGMLYVPNIKTIFSVMMVQSMFISVRLSGRGGVMVAFFAVSCFFVGSVIMTVFVEFTAMVNDYSVRLGRFLRKGANYHKGALARRLIRSYKVEAVKSGHFYEIQKVTCLTVLGFISNISGSVLISMHF